MSIFAISNDGMTDHCSVLSCLFVIAVCCVMTMQCATADAASPQASRYRIEKSLDISKIFSGLRVGFCLVTSGEHQYVVYYDDQRRMTIAARTLGSDKWQYQLLPSVVGWDSHNYVTMAVDSEGYLHVSGNMHVNPLVYFKSARPHDITSLAPLPMTGHDEDQCTYPHFFKYADGQLLFEYRDGFSGKGRQRVNIYDTKTQSWSRLLTEPLTSAEDMNAYAKGPLLGPDKMFHLLWVWRDTPDCATNHHLSYARSRDLLHWESASGQTAQLPLTIDQTQLWIDAIPSGGGIINGCQKLIFDTDNKPIVFYHKSDANGNMQVYAARVQQGRWVTRPLTNWDKPVIFSGTGSMGFIGISIDQPQRVADGVLSLKYNHKDYGTGRLFVDEKTLKPTDPVAVIEDYPGSLWKRENAAEGIQVNIREDYGRSDSRDNEDVRYILRWETLGSHRDRPREGELPAAGTLRLYKMIRQ